MKIKPCIRFALALFVWALLFSLKSIACVSFAVILHEGAHYAMCKKFKIKVFSLNPLPWGLTVATPLMYESRQQIALSASGPLCNFLILSICFIVKSVFKVKGYYLDMFMLANFADGLLNLLPALPLDGGIILKSVLCSHLGLARGFKLSLKISAFVGAVIVVFGIEAFWVTGYNFSYFAAGLFILSNLRHERELLMCIKKRVFTGEIKSAKKLKYINADASCHAICLANLISCSHTCVFLINDGENFLGELTQERLIEKVFENSLITAGECVEKF